MKLCLPSSFCKHEATKWKYKFAAFQGLRTMLFSSSFHTMAKRKASINGSHKDSKIIEHKSSSKSVFNSRISSLGRGEERCEQENSGRTTKKDRQRGTMRSRAKDRERRREHFANSSEIYVGAAGVYSTLNYSWRSFICAIWTISAAKRRTNPQLLLIYIQNAD